MAEYVDRYDIGSQESNARHMSDYGIIKRIVMDYVMRHRGLFALDLVLVFFKMLTVLARPYLYKTVLDFYIAGTPTDDAVWLAKIISSIAVSLGSGADPNLAGLLLSASLLYVAIAAVEWAVTTAQLYYIEKLGLYVIADIRADFFSHINDLSQRFFEYGNTGRLVSRVTNDAEALKKILSTGVIGLVGDLMMTFSIVLVMAFIDSQLTLVALLIAPLLAVTSRVFQGWIKEAWRTARRNVASLTGKVQDCRRSAACWSSMRPTRST